jgi:FkbH-like protein
MPDGESMNDLSKALGRLRKESSYAAYASVSNLIEKNGNEHKKKFRIAILRNVTIEPLLPVISGEIAQLGMQPDIYVGGFDAIAEDIFDPDSAFCKHKADAVILFQWLELISQSLQNEILSLGLDGIEDEITRVLGHFRSQFTALRSQTTASVFVNNFAELYRPVLGILEAQGGGVQQAAMVKLNSGLAALAREFSDIYIVDLQALFSKIGSETAFDDRYWAMAKAPLGKSALVPVGQEYGRFIRALSGQSRKCLVLDCDGTLWGGIVGEDGMEGIRLGLEYPGNSFVAFQNEILNLYHRGIILAICSKNNEEDVLEVLRDHPNMILKEEHFAAIRVNWSDKADNLIGIADELNIGIESLVFADDTDFECDRIRGALPDVGVLHLGGDPSSYRRQLLDAGMFDALTFSDDDLKRNQSYQAERKRKSLSTTATSLEDYLASLEIKARIENISDDHIPRASQLSLKTNQFNLTTKRYTESDIRALASGEDSAVISMWLGDSVAEIGIIGLGIVCYENATAEIDTFLMSCRALGRKAENALLKVLIDNARGRGCSVLKGTFLPTKKNAQVSNFYEKQYFNCDEKKAETSLWSLDLNGQNADRIIFPPWIELVKPEEHPK